MTSADLPASSAEHPRTRLLRTVRPVAARLMRRRWRITVHQPDEVPATGGVILAANHVGIIDGPLLATYSPRPVHALTKSEMFGGRLGGFLRATGQIPLDRFAPDPGAIRTSLRVVRDGGVVGIFPEGGRGRGDLARAEKGVAWLAVQSGAPVVPVACLGTRATGAAADSWPRLRSRLVADFGEPVVLTRANGIPGRVRLDRAAEEIRIALASHVAQASARHGIDLPTDVPTDLWD